MYGNFDIIFGPSLPHSSVLHHPAHAVGHSLLGAQAYRMLIGARDPMQVPKLAGNEKNVWPPSTCRVFTPP